jgi:transposase
MSLLKTYDQEFKKRAVAMLRHSGKPMMQIARELGCSTTALSHWKRKYDDPLAGCLEPEGATIEQLRAENKRLSKELARVTEQREILKKVTAILGQ